MATSVTGSSTWLDAHPRMASALGWMKTAFDYVFFFKWVVDAARWMITTGGNIAESAFLIATAYVTVNTVAHTLVSWLLPQTVIMTLNQIAVIAFSVLPELIIFTAIKVTFDHYRMAFSAKRVSSWAWAVSYTLPTLVFLYLTVITISSFVSVEAASTTAPQATGGMLVTRCLAGWGYGLLQMLFIQLGKESYSGLFASLKAEISDLGGLLAAREELVNDLRGQIGVLQEQCDTLNNDLINARLAIAKMARGSSQKNTLPENTFAESTGKSTFAENTLPEHSEKSTFETGKKNTPTVFHDAKYQRLKEHLERAILNGEKINLKRIAAAASVSYSMARRNAQSIIDALLEEQERDTDTLRLVRSEDEQEQESA